MRAATVCCLVLLALCPQALAQEAPSDDASMIVEIKANEDISVSQLLQAWANRFDALPLVDDQVKGIKVRFLRNTNRPLTWGTLKGILLFHGVQVTEERVGADGHWMLKAEQAMGMGTKPGGLGRVVQGKDLPSTEELVTAVFAVEHGAGQSIFGTVRALQTRGGNRIGSILYVQGPELLIIVDLTSRVRYLEQLISALDAPGPQKRLEIFQVEHADASELATVLTQILASLRQAGGGSIPQAPQGRGGSGTAEVIADARTNRIAVAAFPIDFPRIERVIREFDVPVRSRSGRYHTYRCRNMDAKELEERLQQVFMGRSPASGGGGGGARGGGTPVRRPAGPPARSDETLIVADPQTNTLLIRTDEQTYLEILAVLTDLDRKPRRVNIEIIVYEVSTPTDQMTIAFEIASLSQPHEGSIRPAGGTSYGLSRLNPSTNASGNVTGISRTPIIKGGLTALLTKDTFDKIPIIMRAVQSYEETRVVDRSFAVTNDNKEATFRITSKIPYFTNDVNQGVSVQNVRTVDAVSAVTVTPRVNSDDNLTLKVQLTLTTVAAAGAPGLPPTTNTREFTGEAVTVPNNDYVVFGGLESESESEVETKVPILGDIPLLGHLFKSWQRSRSRSRVYIFVRPTVLSDDDFGSDRHLADHLLEKVAVASGHDPWLPLVRPSVLGGAGYCLQDQVIDSFGTGSANPLGN